MSSKKYFVYELKKSLFVICSIALIMTAITVTAVLTSRYNDVFWIGDRIESGIGVVSFLVGLLAAVVPVWMFSYKMEKRSADLYYALPLSRRQILRTKYLIGLIAVYAPYTIAFVLGALAAVIRFPSGAMAGEYYFPAYFASLPAIFCIYSIASFVFTRANRTLDGIVFIIFWELAPFVLMSIFQRLFRYTVAADWFLPDAPLATLIDYFSNIIEMPGYVPYALSRNTVINMSIGFSFTGLWAIAATVLLFVTERKAKAENIGAVSASPFGYKVMIPLFTVCIIANLDLMDRIYPLYLVVLIVSAAFMLTALYKHTFKIGKVQAIIFGSSVAVGIILALVLEYITTVM